MPAIRIRVRYTFSDGTVKPFDATDPNGYIWDAWRLAYEACRTACQERGEVFDETRVSKSRKLPTTNPEHGA